MTGNKNDGSNFTCEYPYTNITVYADIQGPDCYKCEGMNCIYQELNIDKSKIILLPICKKNLNLSINNI